MKALIIVDMFVRDVKNRSDKKKLIENQLKLIALFNKHKQKVIIVGGPKNGKPNKHINQTMINLWGEEISKIPKENKIIPELLKTKYDFYVEKNEYSAFFKTKLDSICKKEKIEQIFLAGISSGVCLYFTAADAVMRDIMTHIVSDASGAPNLKSHKQNLKNYNEIIGEPITTKELIEELYGLIRADKAWKSYETHPEKWKTMEANQFLKELEKWRLNSHQSSVKKIK